jgi:tyrosyl-tRNA synthetase
MTADGRKMGKTEKGAIWLDPSRTSPYEYYQFWINTDDRDVRRFLALFTFLPTEEVEEYGKLEGADLRKAKEALAFETTKIVHGKEEAQRAKAASEALFISVSDSLSIHESVTITVEDSFPTTVMDEEKFTRGVPIFRLFEATGLCSSGSEARRLIEQGGAYFNKKRVERFDYLVTQEDFTNRGEIL